METALKKLILSFGFLLCIQAISLLAQGTVPADVFPGDPPPAPPNFTAQLSGANACPPDNSPFTATASVFDGVTDPVLGGLFVYFRVDFPISQFTNNPNDG